MSDRSADDHVLVGRVVKPHGIRGELVVESLSEVPGRFDAGTRVLVAGKWTDIVSSREHQGRLLLAVDTVADRTAAERLRGAEVRAEPVPLEDTETYFAHELVGMVVRDVSGASLGTVTALIELPAAAGYDLLEVEHDTAGRWLLPAVDDYVEVRDAREGTAELVLVDPPEGLLEDVLPVDADTGEDGT